MNAATHACPHCGSHNHRLLADHMGRVGWCRDCHRTWEASPHVASPPPACRDPRDQRERQRA